MSRFHLFDYSVRNNTVSTSGSTSQFVFTEQTHWVYDSPWSFELFIFILFLLRKWQQLEANIRVIQKIQYKMRNQTSIQEQSRTKSTKNKIIDKREKNWEWLTLHNEKEKKRLKENSAWHGGNDGSFGEVGDKKSTFDKVFTAVVHVHLGKNVGTIYFT